VINGILKQIILNGLCKVVPSSSHKKVSTNFEDVSRIDNPWWI